MLREKKIRKKGIDYFHDETTRARLIKKKKKEGNFNVLLAFLLAVVVSPLKKAKRVFLSREIRHASVDSSMSPFAIITDATSKYIYIYIYERTEVKTRPRWRFSVFRAAREQGRRGTTSGISVVPINCASKRAKLRLTGPGLTEENRNNA